MRVDPPTRLPAPPTALGRLGQALGWLAAAQGGWPPHRPTLRQAIEVATGGLPGGIAAADALADSGVDLVTVEGPPVSRAALVTLCVLRALRPDELGQ